MVFDDPASFQVAWIFIFNFLTVLLIYSSWMPVMHYDCLTYSVHKPMLCVSEQLVTIVQYRSNNHVDCNSFYSIRCSPNYTKVSEHLKMV